MYRTAQAWCRVPTVRHVLAIQIQLEFKKEPLARFFLLFMKLREVNPF